MCGSISLLVPCIQYRLPGVGQPKCVSHSKREAMKERRTDMVVIIIFCFDAKRCVACVAEPKPNNPHDGFILYTKLARLKYLKTVVGLMKC